MLAQHEDKVLAEIEKEVLETLEILRGLLYKKTIPFLKHKQDLEKLRVQIMMDLEQDKEMAHNNCQSVKLFFSLHEDPKLIHSDFSFLI